MARTHLSPWCPGVESSIREEDPSSVLQDAFCKLVRFNVWLQFGDDLEDLHNTCGLIATLHLLRIGPLIFLYCLKSRINQTGAGMTCFDLAPWTVWKERQYMDCLETPYTAKAYSARQLTYLFQSWSYQWEALRRLPDCPPSWESSRLGQCRDPSQGIISPLHRYHRRNAPVSELTAQSFEPGKWQNMNTHDSICKAVSIFGEHFIEIGCSIPAVQE